MIGPGPIGLLVLQYAKLKHPGRLILVGLPGDTRRLEIGRQLGATDTIALPPDEAIQQINALTEGRGADRVLQCAGVVQATTLALAIAGKDATIAIEGVSGTNNPAPMSPDILVTKQITVRGVCGWTVPDFAAALQINQAGLVNLKPLLTHRFTLDQFDAAFEMTGKYRDGVIKAAFVFPQ